MKEVLKKRDPSIDALKGLLIFLVVLGHSTGSFHDLHFFQYSTEGFYNLDFFRYLNNALSSSRMPAFIFLSGYLSKKISLKKTITGVLFTWIILELFYSLTDVLFYGEAYKLNLYYPNWGMWYLLSLSTWRFSLNFIKPNNLILAVFTTISILFLYFDLSIEQTHVFSWSRTLSFYPYFLFGFLVKKGDIQLNRIKVKPLILTTIGACLLFSIFYFYPHLKSPFWWHVISAKQYELSFYQLISVKIMSMAIAFCAIVSLWSIKSKLPSLFIKIGMNSMVVYSFHFLILDFIKANKFFKFIPSNSFILMIYSISISALISFVFSRDNIAPVLQKFITFKGYKSLFSTQEKTLIHEESLNLKELSQKPGYLNIQTENLNVEELLDLITMIDESYDVSKLNFNLEINEKESARPRERNI